MNHLKYRETSKNMLERGYLIETGRAMCKKPRRPSRFLFGTENDHVVGWIRCNLSVIRSFQRPLEVRIDYKEIYVTKR